MGVAAGDHIEGHTISITTMCAVAATVGPLVWLAGTAVQRLKDEITELRKDIVGINERLDTLPCNGKAVCPEKPKT